MKRKQQILKDFHERLAAKLTELKMAAGDVKLYEQAFSHSSFINDFKLEKLMDNERLEFLGDAVLELVVFPVLIPGT